MTSVKTVLYTKAYTGNLNLMRGRRPFNAICFLLFQSELRTHYFGNRCNRFQNVRMQERSSIQCFA